MGLSNLGHGFELQRSISVRAVIFLVALCIWVTSTTLSFAQSSDGGIRVNQLEDQIRRLNGQMEELNFQLLQMQEQMRRMQEDNEFRFQELENKKQGRLGAPPGTNNDVALATQQKAPRLGKRDTSDLDNTTSNSGVNNDDSQSSVRSNSTQKNLPRMIDGVEIFDGRASQSRQAERQSPLGTITFDAAGNIIDTALGKPLDLTSRLGVTDENQDKVDSDQENSRLVSSQPRNSSENNLSASELFENGYDYFQSGDYFNSKKAFSEYSEQYPDEKKLPNARFWLGESMFSLGDFEGAAKVFLDAHSNWPDARIAPQTLLKLGVSLAGMQQRELACATYVKVYKKYPDMSNALRKRVAVEQKSSRCLAR